MSLPSRVWMPTDNGWVSRETTDVDRDERNGILRWLNGETVEKDGKRVTVPLVDFLCYHNPIDGSAERHEIGERERASALAAGREAIEEARRAKEKAE